MNGHRITARIRADYIALVYPVCISRSDNLAVTAGRFKGAIKSERFSKLLS